MYAGDFKNRKNLQLMWAKHIIDSPYDFQLVLLITFIELATRFVQIYRCFYELPKPLLGQKCQSFGWADLEYFADYGVVSTHAFIKLYEELLF